MLVESDRLLLRPVEATDADLLAELHRDPLVVELIMNGRPLSRADSDARLELYLDEWRRFGFGFWMVYEKLASGLRFAGRAGLRDFDGIDVELGYCFSGASTGRGLATEAGRAVMHTAFEIYGLPQLVAVVRPLNERSQRVIGKLGFVQRGMRRHKGIDFLYYERRAPVTDTGNPARSQALSHAP